MDFEDDAFISYAHLDDVALVEGRKGWVSNLHRALEVRAAQLLGKPPAIWRDPKLHGNDLFEDSLVERLRRVAVLVTVVSPRYLRSEWTLRELREFREAAERQGGIGIQDRARVFKVIKTPVPHDRVPPELQGLLGYEFFKVDPETGKVRELDEVFGPEAHRDFWLKLDDLAHDLCALLESLESEQRLGGGGGSLPTPATPGLPAGVPAASRSPGTLPVVYLATTTSDLSEERDALQRELREHGYRVLPDRPMPLVAHEAEALIRESLAQSRMSIHLIGRNYGIVPEGGHQSNMSLQHELATERSRSGGFRRLLWIPRDLQVEDPRQRRLIEDIRMDPGLEGEADVLETFFEDLRTVALDWLRRAVERDADPTPEPEPRAGSVHAGTPPLLYLVAEQRDAERIHGWADPLFDDGFEVQYPIFEGDEAELREYHEECLNTCDAVLIFYGAGNEIWLRRKLREIQKSPGYGRVKPPAEVGVCLIGPRVPGKERFRTHEAVVIPQWEGFDRASLDPFLARVRAAHGA